VTTRLGNIAFAALVPVLLLCSALPAEAEEINNANRYDRCMALAESDPNDGLDFAEAWKGLGGGDAAEHCAAVSLFYAGKTEYAARRLEVLADKIVAKPAFKGRILDQAGQAWLMHGDAARAEAAFTEAVKLLKGRPGVKVDRAQARAAMGDYKGAVADLNDAIAADPAKPEAYTFRASAERYLGEMDKARSDINKALKLAPNDPAALLERGILNRLAGDNKGARRDWLRVLELDPKGEAGKLAQANIEKMDVKGE